MGKATHELTYEQMLIELENIVQKMEQGGLSLEDTMVLYEKGAALEKKLGELLEKSKRRVTMLIDRKGSPSEIPFEEDAN